MNKKCLVDFGLTPVLGKGGSQNDKMKEPIMLNQIIKVVDENPVIRFYDENKVDKAFKKVINGPYLPRFMTVTIVPNKHIHKMDDYLISAKCPIGKQLQQQIWDKIFNKFKAYGSNFIGCLEFHKYRVGIKHLHCVYNIKNLNRLRLLKKAIKDIVGKSNSCIKTDVIKGNVDSYNKVLCYIKKKDENNINKNTGEVESPKEYVKWIVKKV